MPRNRRSWADPDSRGAPGPLGSEFLRDLERYYRAHGADMIATFRKNEPRNYLKLLLSPVPKRPSAETEQEWIEGLSDEELEAILKFARAELAKCADLDGQG